MYQLQTTDFGKFERYTVSHEIHPQSISFIPSRGGCLLSVVLESQEVLDGYQTPEEVDFNNWGKSGVLYPFPNRLREGHYEWLGKTYQFPINDATFQNALHGFGMTRPLTVCELSLETDQAHIGMEGEYAGELPYYPWPFTFGLTYRLYAPDQLWVEMSVKNTGTTPIPVGLGWHPYFQLGETAAVCELILPSMDLVGIDARMIPTGKRYPYTEFAQRRKIGSTVLDNCFAVPETHLEVGAYLCGPRGALRYWQETGPDKFNFLQVFTPPYGTSIAMEPMTCNVDAFHNGDGLKALEPGATLRAKAGIQFLVEE